MTRNEEKALQTRTRTTRNPQRERRGIPRGIVQMPPSEIIRNIYDLVVFLHGPICATYVHMYILAELVRYIVEVLLQ